jgi:DNA polymerase
MPKPIEYKIWKEFTWPHLKASSKLDCIDWSQIHEPQTLDSTPKQPSLFGQRSSNREKVESLPFEFYPNWKDVKFFIESALCHTSEKKFDHLYRFLIEYQHNHDIFNDPLHFDVQALKKMQHQVSRDIHKMRAFVRFHETIIDGKTFYIAFHEPDHAIVLKNASFFKDRFSTMNWVILSSYCMMAFNGKKIFYQLGRFAKPDFPKDDFVDLWKTYFVHIFNPARVKIKAMKNEMPVRYWKNMPETQLIKEMIQSAPQRVQKMIQNMPRKNVYPKARTNTDLLKTDLKRVKLLFLFESKEAFVPLKKFQAQWLATLNLTANELMIDYLSRYMPPAGVAKQSPSWSLKEILRNRPLFIKHMQKIEPEHLICMGKKSTMLAFGYPKILSEGLHRYFYTTACSATWLARPDDFKATGWFQAQIEKKPLKLKNKIFHEAKTF